MQNLKQKWRKNKIKWVNKKAKGWTIEKKTTLHQAPRAQTHMPMNPDTDTDLQTKGFCRCMWDRQTQTRTRTQIQTRTRKQRGFVGACEPDRHGHEPEPRYRHKLVNGGFVRACETHRQTKRETRDNNSSPDPDLDTQTQTHMGAGVSVRVHLCPLQRPTYLTLSPSPNCLLVPYQSPWANFTTCSLQRWPPEDYTP